MGSTRHTLRVVFAPGVHITREAKDAIAARLGGQRELRHLWADFITVTGCRRGLPAAAGALSGEPHVVAVEEGPRRALLRPGQPGTAADRA
jgi:hypothetical protein